MSREIKDIVQLIELWEQFKSHYQKGDYRKFGQWLLYENPEKEISSKKETAYMPNQLDQEIGLIWGRLLRYTHIWAKRGFNEITLNSMEEFGILMNVQIHGALKKGELVKLTKLETTTCFEIIKRLLKQEYLTEQTNNEDKRSRKVQITALGKQVVWEAYGKMEEISALLTGHLSEKEKNTLLHLLKKLDNFHEYIYEKEDNQEFSKLIRNYKTKGG